MIVEKGVIYVAVGSKYVSEATTSVHSLKVHCPNLPATLFTDHKSCGRQGAKAFDSVVWIDADHARGKQKLSKIEVLRYSPYKRTLFLDADTYICAGITEMFRLLDWYDMALAFSSRRKLHKRTNNIPDWFTERNSGVILYRSTPEVFDLFKHWIELYRRFNRAWGCTSDQVSLRTVLFQDKILRVGTLAPEFNCFIPCPVSLAGKVFILHGRGDMAALAAEVNHRDGMRVYLPRIGIINRKQFDVAVALKAPSKFVVYDIPGA